MQFCKINVLDIIFFVTIASIYFEETCPKVVLICHNSLKFSVIVFFLLTEQELTENTNVFELSFCLKLIKTYEMNKKVDEIFLKIHLIHRTNYD